MRAVRLIASVSALTLAAAAGAQTSYPSPYGSSPYASVPSPYAVQPLSDADLLASQIRLLAANPQDLQVLVRAGELALKLDDDTAAAAFFARAERIDPRNARVKAGEGSLLVSAERPGDALRHFAEAERLGADPRSFAADRGLAYDLIGEQERAQRDYRVALRAGANDETQRRYALSLGISGKRDLALTQIDTLLRKSDRGAWRARAFILAMSGDKAGATRIATSMMPTGMAQGLQPFFDVLPNLRPVDRAFAVHFGEVRPSLDRVNDARLVPPLAALGPDPTAPVQVAAVVKAPVVVDAREERRRAREARRNRGRVQVAVASTPPAVPAEPLPAPPAYGSTAPRVALAANTPRAVPMTTAPTTSFVQRVPGTTQTSQPYASAQHAPTTPYVQPLPAPHYAQRSPSTVTQAANLAANPAPTAAATPRSLAAPTSPTSPSVSRPVQLAALPSGSVATPVVPAATPYRSAVPTAASLPAPATAAPSSPVVQAATITPLPVGERSAAPLTARLGVPPAAVTSGSVARATPAFAGTPSATLVPEPPVAAPPSASTGTLAAAAETSTTVAAQPPAVVTPPPAAPTPVRSEDTILAAIISDIKVPADERSPQATGRATPAPIQRALASAPLVDTTRADELAAEKKAAAERKLAEKKAADQAALADAKKAAADKKLADAKKAAAEKKIADAKKAAADKKLADAKAAAEEKRKHDPKLLEPSRIWVQVAGGANEADLPKQWSKLRSGNKQLAGRSGWTTPLRATNRILTGPFKTEDEAQTFVNKIAKDGQSGFVFVSDAGQKITKLGAK
ncbi:SPOR domain-containing protein [Sphingomonas sp. PAMC 26605]|uniref:SPOR domain-containing protein n=1 Tax=Sphingomonas sp. PAMC 26605 TaxID=1112214 RepID=UPI00026CDC5C|nr:SPOR domain-containing protein [Sphingomonas sp. PAMC 26605]